MTTVVLRRKQFRTEEAIAKPTEDGMVITLPGLAIGCTPVEFHEFVERVWSTYFSGISHAAVLDGMLPGGTK